MVHEAGLHTQQLLLRHRRQVLGDFDQWVVVSIALGKQRHGQAARYQHFCSLLEGHHENSLFDSDSFETTNDKPGPVGQS